MTIECAQIYFLKDMFKTFGKFQDFKAMVDKQSGRYIKVLNYNGGGKYDSNKFLEYCREQDINEQFTTKYTQQKNIVEERKKWTIMNMARSILKSKCLSNDFSEKVVSCLVYILNRGPTKSVKDKSPFRAWTSRNPCIPL